jgi:hypothetical protein
MNAMHDGNTLSSASGAELAAAAHEGRSWGSRLLWMLDSWTGHPLTALTVLAAGLAWVLLSVAYGCRMPSTRCWRSSTPPTTS